MKPKIQVLKKNLCALNAMKNLKLTRAMLFLMHITVFHGYRIKFHLVWPETSLFRFRFSFTLYGPKRLGFLAILDITKTYLFKYTENFTTKKKKKKKKENFQIRNSDIFHISAQIIDCGYSLGLVEAVRTNTHNLWF